MLFLLASALMYVNNNLVNVSDFLRSIINFLKERKDVNVNIKMLSMIIHAGYKGGDYCRRKLIFFSVFFSAMLLSLYPA